MAASIWNLSEQWGCKEFKINVFDFAQVLEPEIHQLITPIKNACKDLITMNIYRGVVDDKSAAIKNYANWN